VQNIGIFCGTFNPIHLGHLLAAESARDQFRLDKVIFVTSPRPPHRNDLLLEANERFELVALAVANNPYFEASPLEIERAGPSYTIDTVVHFAELYGSEAQINLLLGADNIMQITTWHRSAELCSQVRFLVAPRFSDDTGAGECASLNARPPLSSSAISSQCKYELIDFPAVDISSSEIRRRLRVGRSVLYMVPPAVNELLLQRGYYGAVQASGPH
jgi:nicotinate-nucleotide adenylyltransferase